MALIILIPVAYAFTSLSTNYQNAGKIGLGGVLEQNSSNYITIGADNIVLDCDGHNIIGYDAVYKYGMYNYQHNRVTIKNCKLQNFTYGNVIWGCTEPSGGYRTQLIFDILIDKNYTNRFDRRTTTQYRIVQ